MIQEQPAAERGPLAQPDIDRHGAGAPEDRLAVAEEVEEFGVVAVEEEVGDERRPRRVRLVPWFFLRRGRIGRQCAGDRQQDEA